MNIISIDLEYNQPSRKIIQLGFIVSNVKTKEIKCAKSIFINPNEPLSNDIIRLTGITQDKVDVGVTLVEAYQEMTFDINKYEVNKHPIQWGLDHNDLRNSLFMDWDRYIFNKRAHDIKSLYQLYQMMLPNGKTVAGLGNSISRLNMQWDFTYGGPHNALADAHNTLLVYFNIGDKLKKHYDLERLMGKR